LGLFMGGVPCGINCALGALQEQASAWMLLQEARSLSEKTHVDGVRKQEI